jgi:hypothetical protein
MRYAVKTSARKPTQRDELVTIVKNNARTRTPRRCQIEAVAD